MKLKSKLMSAVAGVAVALSAQASLADGHMADLTVAYFPEWPVPGQWGQANGAFEEAGLNIKWISFDTGTAMSAAMASGDVHIAYSQGVTPFLVATAAGQDLTAVDVGMTYSDNDNCVVRSTLEIDKTNASELAGLQVAVPLGTAAHSGFLTQMKHFGVDPDSMKIVDMSPVDSAAAFASGELDMACGWGGPLRRMKEHGNVLIEGAEKEAVVGKVFDLVSVPTGWAEENAETLSKFLAVNAAMETKYATDGADMIADIANVSGMDIEGASYVLGIFGFPSVETKLSDEWLGGFVESYLSENAASLEASGQITALDDYGSLVDGSYLQAASGM